MNNLTYFKKSVIVQTNYNSKVWLILLEFFKSKLNIFVEIVTEILLRKWTKVTFSLVVLGHEYIRYLVSPDDWISSVTINSRFSKVEGGLSPPPPPPRVWRRGAPPQATPHFYSTEHKPWNMLPRQNQWPGFWYGINIRMLVLGFVIQVSIYTL
jgi:hypothetical protein